MKGQKDRSFVARAYVKVILFKFSEVETLSGHNLAKRRVKTDLIC